MLKVALEIDKEVALSRIVAIAQHRLPFEMLLVVTQLFLDVRQLGVELVLLGRLCCL